MNIIPYKYLIYFSYLSSLVVSIAPFFFLDKISTLSAVILSVLGLIILVVSLISKDKEFPKIHIVGKRTAVLSLYVESILITFSQFIFGFPSGSILIWILYSVSILQLVALLFTRLD
jgi:hypothetical protein